MDEFYAADIAVYSIYADTTMEQGMSTVKGYYGGKTGNFYTNQKTWSQGFRPWRALVDLRTMKIVMAEGFTGSGAKQYPLEKFIEACKSLP